MGAKLFSRRHQDKQIAFVIRHHHERLDGSGYPAGLRGEELTLMVRIVSVADVYEALVAKRVYKDSMSSAKAFDLLWLDVAEGRLDGKVVVALSQVLEDWDPLSLTRNFAADYMLDLELFRRMSYFKEPLTEFYNYRYLYFLDDAKLLGKNRKPYHLMATNFIKLRKFNQDNGHAKVDQILEDVGHRLQDMVDSFIVQCLQVEGTVRLFRKGADYLLYTDYPPLQAVILREQVAENLLAVASDWQLETRMVNQQYAIGYPVEKALDELFTLALHDE
jgi:GGDEF domain-containing protein